MFVGDVGVGGCGNRAPQVKQKEEGFKGTVEQFGQGLKPFPCCFPPFPPPDDDPPTNPPLINPLLTPLPLPLPLPPPLEFVLPTACLSGVFSPDSLLSFSLLSLSILSLSILSLSSFSLSILSNSFCLCFCFSK